ncbi:MAG: TatD family hydrolase, partial [Bacteriovoracales bacterium]
DYLKKETLPEILEKCKQSHVEKIITISVNKDNLDTVIDLTSKSEMIYCSQGLHPHEAKDFDKSIKEKILKNAKSEKVVAIGEIGLDFYYNHSPKQTQVQVFEEQLQMALDLHLPVIIHTRDAEFETKEILENFPRIRGVVHSFTSSVDLASFLIDRGLFIGFNGIISFKNAQNVRDVLKMTPLEAILLETDSPFLTPVPHRGRENSPYMLPFVAASMINILNIPASTLLPQVYKNSMELFLTSSKN